jgi:hypothetical protein
LATLILGIAWWVQPSAGHERPVSDAELVALEFAGTLLPPPDQVARIDNDLKLIRARIPDLREVRPISPWAVGCVLVQLTEKAFDEYLVGHYHGLDALNEILGTPEVSTVVSRWLILTFEPPYHPVRLAEIYLAGEGVIATSVDALYGGPWTPWTDIELRAEGEYVLTFSVEMMNRWVIRVVNDTLVILEQPGSSTAVSDASWGRIKVRARSLLAPSTN